MQGVLTAEHGKNAITEPSAVSVSCLQVSQRSLREKRHRRDCVGRQTRTARRGQVWMIMKGAYRVNQKVSKI